MTGPELAAALSDLGLSKYRFSIEAGVEPSTVSKWCKPGASVPGYVARIIELMRENRELRRKTMRTVINTTEFHLLGELAKGLPGCAVMLCPKDADRLLVEPGYAQRLHPNGYRITEAGRERLDDLRQAITDNHQNGHNTFG